MHEVAMEDVIYTAGLFDGEGSGHIGNAGVLFKAVLQLTNTNAEIVEWLHQTFGIGHTYQAKENGNRKACWKWIVYKNDDILDFLYAIEPYMRIKLKMVQLLITYLELQTHPFDGSGKGYSMPSREMEMRASYRDELLELNRRGNHHAEANQTIHI